MGSTFISIISGFIFLIILFLLRVWFRQGYRYRQIIKARNALAKSPKFRKPSIYQENNLTNNLSTDSERKGIEFEKFIVSLFDRSYFTILEWRSDKHHNGIYALSNKYPDIEMRYATKYVMVFFAIECKWRSAFKDDRIQWAKDYQFENYKSFEQQRKIPVYVMLGVGGVPSNPSELYVIPLNRINSIYLQKSYLRDFKRYRADKNLFLNPNSMSLH